MKKILLLTALICAWTMPGFGQKNPFLGRWDLTITPQSGTAYPGWMEITEKDGTAAFSFFKPHNNGCASNVFRSCA